MLQEYSNSAHPRLRNHENMNGNSNTNNIHSACDDSDVTLTDGGGSVGNHKLRRTKSEITSARKPKKLIEVSQVTSSTTKIVSGSRRPETPSHQARLGTAHFGDFSAASALDDDSDEETTIEALPGNSTSSHNHSHNHPRRPHRPSIDRSSITGSSIPHGKPRGLSVAEGVFATEPEQTHVRPV